MTHAAAHQALTLPLFIMPGRADIISRVREGWLKPLAFTIMHFARWAVEWCRACHSEWFMMLLYISFSILLPPMPAFSFIIYAACSTASRRRIEEDGDYALPIVLFALAGFTWWCLSPINDENPLKTSCIAGWDINAYNCQHMVRAMLYWYAAVWRLFMTCWSYTWALIRWKHEWHADAYFRWF